MTVPEDPGVVAVAAAFGLGAGALLGRGGEASVYAFGDDRILRILRAGGRVAELERRRNLITELCAANVSFDLPEILDIAEHSGRVFSIERRLPGAPVSDVLALCSGRERRRLVEAYLDAVAELGDLHLDRRSTFGDLILDERIITSTWPRYLVQRAAANLARSTGDLRHTDLSGLADELPDVQEAEFVHLDAYPGNVLAHGARITAVIDIGSTSVAGDRRFDPLSAAVYLASSQITPVVTPADIDVAMSWLRAAGLVEWFEPVRRWLAAFWSFAVDDPALLGWCRGVLLEHR